MYYVWDVSMTNPFWTEIEITNFDECRARGWELALRFSDNLPDDLPPIQVKVVSRKRPSDMLKASNKYFTSERLRQIFDDLGVKARYFPAELTWKKVPYTERKFYLMKLHDNLDALDTTKSDFDLDNFPAMPYIHMRRVVLRNDVAQGHHFFSLAKCLDMILIASEELVNAVKAAGLTGMTILTLEKWSDYATNGIPADEVV